MLYRNALETYFSKRKKEKRNFGRIPKIQKTLMLILKQNGISYDNT